MDVKLEWKKSPKEIAKEKDQQAEEAVSEEKQTEEASKENEQTEEEPGNGTVDKEDEKELWQKEKGQQNRVFLNHFSGIEESCNLINQEMTE